MKEFHAITLTSEKGKLREISTEITVKPCHLLIKHFKISDKGKIVKGIWDTGATGSCISAKIVKELNLIPIGKQKIMGVNSITESNTYLVDFILPNNVRILEVQAVEATSLGEYDVLIGMDVITLGDFSITNAENRTVFSFRIPPSDKHIDYVKEWNELKNI